TLWNNERISWDPDQFCGITHITIPREILWKPDVFIYEYDGTITSEDDIKIVSTCKMDVHKFPFDTQKCNITIGSASHCPLLHVINFLLPILFFLTLDLASFFIADHRGEKLGFKVTVLLAISVLLLILNDILPSMSNKTPLIGTDSFLKG
uniref:Si:dkey-49c17.4 n=1 Tax=Pundamilia nyererei TaxID=303518 RepID=A0A3B4ESK4_9CICH